MNSEDRIKILTGDYVYNEEFIDYICANDGISYHTLDKFGNHFWHTLRSFDFHRENGPAVINIDRSVEYWINNIKIVDFYNLF